MNQARRVFVTALLAAGAALAQDTAVPVPKVTGPIPVTADSYPFAGGGHTSNPIDFAKAGYVEEEFLVSGEANVYDWSTDGTLTVKTHNAPYTTRILVRRPINASRFSGNVVVEPFMPARRFDWPIMWGYIHESLMEHGDAWVGVSVPGTSGGLKKFNPSRYSTVSFANPAPGAVCPGASKNGPSNIEDGLRFDMLSQVGAALKSGSSGPMGNLKVEGIYMTEQGGDLLTYMNAIHPHSKLSNGKFVYDGYLSRNPGNIQRVNQCDRPPQANDPRGGFQHKFGVPVIAVVAQGEVAANLDLRRADSEDPGDRFRLYEVAGVSHIDKAAYAQFPTVADQTAAVGAAQGTAEWPFNVTCEPSIAMTDQPALTYVYDAAFQHLFTWARKGVAPPKADRIEVKEPSEPGAKPTVALDEYGNALGGVRTPYVDVPEATYFASSTGPGVCGELGHSVPFEHSRLATLYPDAGAYRSKVAKDVGRLVKEGWLTKSDGRKIESQLGSEAAH